MNTKWLKILTGTLLSVMLMAGCNTNNNEGNPPPANNNDVTPDNKWCK